MFTIESFIGAVPLRFGMTPNEVAATIGPPDRVFRNPFDDLCEERRKQHLNLSYSNETGLLNELVFSPGAQLFFRGKALFSEVDVVAFLQTADSEPKSAVGMIFFLELGIRLSGFHDGDESQKSIAVTPQGHWDDYISDLKDF